MSNVLHVLRTKSFAVRRKLHCLLITMKLEVDLSDRRKLEELRDELRSKLEVVEFALTKLPVKGSSARPAEAVNLDFAESTTSLAGRIVKAILDMGDRFKSSDVYNRIPDISRSAIKDVFRQYVDSGRLKIVEQGIGQRPTIYQKTSSFDKDDETIEL